MTKTLPLQGGSSQTVRLEELTTENIDQANQLSVKPGRERFILPVTYSLIVTPTDPHASWQRVAVLDDQVVGFIHANLDPNPDTPEEFRACLWRLYVDADVHGHRIGTRMIRAFSAEAARAGLKQITAIWEPGDIPEDALHRLGFTDIGQTGYGETISALAI